YLEPVGRILLSIRWNDDASKEMSKFRGDSFVRFTLRSRFTLPRVMWGWNFLSDSYPSFFISLWISPVSRRSFPESLRLANSTRGVLRLGKAPTERDVNSSEPMPGFILFRTFCTTRVSAGDVSPTKSKV